MTPTQAIAISLITFVLGFGLAWLLAPRRQKKNATAQQLKEEMNHYQQNVEQHLVQTAELLDELTASYKKVHDHLNHTAQSLLSEEQLQHLAQQRQHKGYRILRLEEPPEKPVNTSEKPQPGPDHEQDGQ